MSFGKLVLVTGGARSGKSLYSEEMAKKLGNKILYVATSIPYDDEMKKRIEDHRNSRPDYWETYEGFKNLHKVLEEKGKDYDGVLLDCITVMITNLMFSEQNFDESKIQQESVDKVEKEISKQLTLLVNTAKEKGINLILVTNEVGSGIVPESKLGRVFRDLAGRANQLLAKRADEVYLLVSSIPVKIK
ncbi:bifunctional adenosylcobinamide kinase/adenosylcobinamide-phosphate guanylyltransferase [Proteinivorax hydrogeniformans]|uniref:Adenosylcobinamide kinase n=1 Tax=Proteinivorax hydrogeniformans TaxID=1826727 RepID=A0AAU8HVB8_9FIRM